MSAAEVNRYYRATCAGLGRVWSFSFRADNLTLAHEHARHCARGERLQVTGVRYLGRDAPVDAPDFGEFREVERTLGPRPQL
jgi:hypothetical protein